MARVLITGASGFIGRALVAALAVDGVAVRGAYRGDAPAGVDAVRVGALGKQTDWRAALEGVDAVVHLASPAHAKFAERELYAAIVDGTRALVEQAQGAGVKRFIYVSSIKAVAARTQGAEAVDERQAPMPEDAYGRAKLAAEQIVLAHAALNPVVLRPPLVHGPEAKANFALLLRLAASPLPLPFADARNQRSVLSLQSFVGAARAVLKRPDGPSGVFHLADQPALSTGAMLAAIRRGFGRAPGLFHAPMLDGFVPAALRESLVVDDRAFRAAYEYAGEGDAAALLSETARAWRAHA
ncbi:MAG TPA: NAD-dependent epimerase/dehydratase family protein [Verrucomicrobiae bacterium]|nr:NAD-dependent epimerase/dehydratase family protein [Verrucomicrobiae bacterium]